LRGLGIVATMETPKLQRAGAPGPEAPKIVECEAFGPDGALRGAVLAWPVEGRRLGPRSEATTSLGEALATPEALLVFLRHFG
jgi:hypothetical protein